MQSFGVVEGGLELDIGGRARLGHSALVLRVELLELCFLPPPRRVELRLQRTQTLVVLRFELGGDGARGLVHVLLGRRLGLRKRRSMLRRRGLLQRDQTRQETGDGRPNQTGTGCN